MDRDDEQLVQAGLDWVDEFLPACREEYSALANLEIDPDYIPKQRRNTFAYSGTMLRILAGCCHEWRNVHPDGSTEQLERYVRAMDFRTNRRGSLLFKSGVVDNEGYSLRGGRREIGLAIRQIVGEASRSAAS